MLKCKVNRKRNYCKIKVKGTARNIIDETLAIVSTIYNGMKKEDPDVADKYKRTLQASMIDPQSPIFTEKHFE